MTVSVGVCRAHNEQCWGSFVRSYLRGVHLRGVQHHLGEPGRPLEHAPVVVVVGLQESRDVPGDNRQNVDLEDMVSGANAAPEAGWGTTNLGRSLGRADRVRAQDGGGGRQRGGVRHYGAVHMAPM